MRYRAEQLSEEIVRLANDVLLRSELPKTILITVVACELSKDTRDATLVVSILPEQCQGTGLQAVRSLLPRVRKAIATSCSLKRIPLFTVALRRADEAVG